MTKKMNRSGKNGYRNNNGENTEKTIWMWEEWPWQKIAKLKNWENKWKLQEEGEKALIANNSHDCDIPRMMVEVLDYSNGKHITKILVRIIKYGAGMYKNYEEWVWLQLKTGKSN